MTKPDCDDASLGPSGRHTGRSRTGRAESDIRHCIRKIRRVCQGLAARCSNMGGLLAAKFEHMSEEIDSVAYEIQCLEDDINQGQIGLTSGKSRSGSRPPTHKRQVQSLAPVFVIEFKTRADGHAEVRINQTKTFILPRALAEVMGILFQAACKASKEPVPWTSYSTIAVALLSPNNVKPPSVHAISNRVYRLREALRDHGYNPAVLERASALGARLAFNPAALSVNAHTPQAVKQVQSSG